jgi:hypothetical protein
MKPVTAIVVQAERSLADLAGAINQAHQDCVVAVRTSLNSALEAGKLLNEAKRRVGHGNWLPWLEDNVGFSEATAKRYMQLDRGRERLEANRSFASDLATISEAIQLLSGREPERQQIGCAGQEVRPDGEVVEDGTDSLRLVMDEPPAEEQEEAVAETRGGRTPAAEVDAWGIPIQAHAAEAFADVDAMKEVIRVLKQAEELVNALAEKPVGRHLVRHLAYHQPTKTREGKWVMSYLHNAIEVVRNSIPRLTDCPYAHNDERPHGGDKCPACHGANWLPDPKGYQIRMALPLRR